jgi:hypothetical protein
MLSPISISLVDRCLLSPLNYLVVIIRPKCSHIDTRYYVNQLVYIYHIIDKILNAEFLLC